MINKRISEDNGGGFELREIRLMIKRVVTGWRVLRKI